MKLLIKIFIGIVVLGIAFLTVVSTYADGGRVCEQYFNIPCQYYNYVTEECNCFEVNYYLNNTMINQRNAMITGQNRILANTPSDYNFTNLAFATNFSNKIKK